MHTQMRNYELDNGNQLTHANDAVEAKFQDPTATSSNVTESQEVEVIQTHAVICGAGPAGTMG